MTSIVFIETGLLHECDGYHYTSKSICGPTEMPQGHLMPCGAVAPARLLQGLTPPLAGVSCPHTGKSSRNEATSVIGSQRSWGCSMRRSTFVLLGLNVSLAVALVLFVALAAIVRA